MSTKLDKGLFHGKVGQAIKAAVPSENLNFRDFQGEDPNGSVLLDI